TNGDGRRQDGRPGGEHRRRPREDAQSCARADDERKRKQAAGAEQDRAAEAAAQRCRPPLVREMPAGGKRAERSREHQRGEQHEREDGLARHHMSPFSSLTAARTPFLIYDTYISRRSGCKDMPVHRAARSRQAALQQVRPLRARSARQAESLTEQAYRVIEEQIVTLRLKPGDILSEQLLSTTTRFGRTPIREALQRLAREGLITILPRKGILVSDINPRNQLL